LSGNITAVGPDRIQAELLTVAVTTSFDKPYVHDKTILLLKLFYQSLHTKHRNVCAYGYGQIESLLHRLTD